jgi:hypothetical protein
MKLRRLFVPLCSGLMLISLSVRAAEQGSYIIPDSGPKSIAQTTVNIVDKYASDLALR